MASTALDQAGVMRAAWLYLVLLVWMPATGWAQRITQIDPTKSSVSFVFKQMGAESEGKFRSFRAQVDFDPKNLTASRAQIEIDLASIDTGLEEADTEAKSKAWFNTANFPTAKFVSGSVKALGGDRFEVTGKLTIKGKTGDVRAPFSVVRSAGGTRFEGAFTLRRLQYGIGDGPWADTETVADEIQIRFHFVGRTAN